MTSPVPQHIEVNLKGRDIVTLPPSAPSPLHCSNAEMEPDGIHCSDVGYDERQSLVETLKTSLYRRYLCSLLICQYVAQK